MVPQPHISLTSVTWRCPEPKLGSHAQGKNIGWHHAGRAAAIFFVLSQKVCGFLSVFLDYVRLSAKIWVCIFLQLTHAFSHLPSAWPSSSTPRALGPWPRILRESHNAYDASVCLTSQPSPDATQACPHARWRLHALRGRPPNKPFVRDPMSVCLRLYRRTEAIR